MNLEEIIDRLHMMANPEAVKKMTRFGINPHNNLGISIYHLRKLGKEIGHDHKLAQQVWDTGIHDARLLACFIEDPQLLTSGQMDSWAKEFDSWDICDQACTNLFDRSYLAWTKIFEWAENKHELVKRAAFAIIAGLAVHNTQATDGQFLQFTPLIKQHASDNRNYVKKAVNWALRNIGKRNKNLNIHMIKLAQAILTNNSAAARWIARDALNELTSKKILKRIELKEKREK